MRTHRRGFIQLMGLGLAGVGCTIPLAAWADRLRILGGVGPPEGPSHQGRQVSSELQQCFTELEVGGTRTYKGFRVCWLHGSAQLPVLRVATLEEARAQGDLLITEREQATVPDLLVENRGQRHVLLLAGEILIGGKQNRMLTEDLLLPPASGPRAICVYCVEQGRWAGRTHAFESKGSFAAPRLRAKAMGRAGQSQIWAEVERSADSLGATSPTHSYQAIYDQREIQAHLEEVARQFTHDVPPRTLGVATFVNRSLPGMDCFTDPDLFRREWPKLLRAQALEAFGEAGQADVDEQELRKRLGDILRAASQVKGDIRGTAGVGQRFEFRLETLGGSALIFGERVVHAAIL